MRVIRLLLADEQALLRTGLRARFGAEPDLEVVGEAGDGDAVVALARRLRPDVAVLDVRLPRRDGLAVTRAIGAEGLPTRVLVYTSADDQLGPALTAGATGFLGKDAAPADLVTAVRAVAAGLVVAPRLPEAGTTPARPALAELTDREREVLVLVARGRSNGEIADELGVSETTVKTHVGRVLTKLELRDRVQAVVFAYECGLVLRGTGMPGGNGLAPAPTVTGDFSSVDMRRGAG